MKFKSLLFTKIIFLLLPWTCGHSTQKFITIEQSTTIKVSSIKKSEKKLLSIIDKLGGYTLRTQRQNQDSEDQTATLEFRLPINSRIEFTRILKDEKFDKSSDQISSIDKTQSYMVAIAELNQAESQEKYLSKLMTTANETQDVLSVFEQLNNVQNKINKLKGQIQYIRQSSDLAKITININKKFLQQTAEKKRWLFTEVIIKGWNNLLDALSFQLKMLTIFLVYYLPILLIWAVLFYAIYFIFIKNIVMKLCRSNKP